MCSSSVGTGKSPDLSDFHPCRSTGLSAIWRCSGSVVFPWAARANFKRNSLFQAGGKCQFNEKQEWRPSVCLQVHGSPSGVIFEEGSVQIWAWWATRIATEQLSPELPKSIHTKKKRTIYMSRPIYCHGPIYCHSPIYCHNSIYGMTFKPFIALCLEGASCGCLDLYAAMTYKLFQNKKKKSCGERV